MAKPDYTDILKRLPDLSDADLWDKLGTNEVPWFNGADELHKRLLRAHEANLALQERLLTCQGEQARLRAEVVALRAQMTEVRKALYGLDRVVNPKGPLAEPAPPA